MLTCSNLGNYYCVCNVDGACGEIYVKEVLFLGKQTYTDV